MAIPKSGKLAREVYAPTQNDDAVQPASTDVAGPVLFDLEPIKIREVACCNEFVAVLPFRINTGLQLAADQQYKNEGIIIGVGPGLPNGAGGRCPSQFRLGDVVAFQDRAVVQKMESQSPPYKGRSVYIMSERNILCKLPPVPFEIIVEA